MSNTMFHFEHIRFPLTRREWKGFLFEIDIMNFLSSMGYGYEGTPVDPVEWKHENTKYRVDIVLDIGVKLECKNIDGKVYKSWYVRNWKSKGSGVFVYRGDLKLSPSIEELYHPVIFHYFLLPIYLNYELPLFRGVTNLYKVGKYENEADDYECIKLKGSAKKVHSRRFEVESSKCSFRNKLKWKIRKISKFILENLIKAINKFLVAKYNKKESTESAVPASGNAELDDSIKKGFRNTKHPEPRTFPLQLCEVRTSCMDS